MRIKIVHKTFFENNGYQHELIDFSGIKMVAVSGVAESQDTGSSTSASSKVMAQDINEYFTPPSSFLTKYFVLVHK